MVRGEGLLLVREGKGEGSGFYLKSAEELIYNGLGGLYMINLNGRCV